MKRYIYLILMLLLAEVVQAQQIAVMFKGGGGVELNESPNDCKITFSDGQMLFHVNGKIDCTFDIKEIQHAVFYAYQTSVDEMEAKGVIRYNPASDELTVDARPGTSVVVYHVKGKRAMSHIQTIASSSFSVAHLPVGAYVVVAGNDNLKFVKR